MSNTTIMQKVTDEINNMGINVSQCIKGIVRLDGIVSNTIKEQESKSTKEFFREDKVQITAELIKKDIEKEGYRELIEEEPLIR